MKLRSLGMLVLEESAFARAKPLCLLCYLALEGVKPRRYIAEIFWPGAQDGMNSLSVALSQLRRGAGECFGADHLRVWTELPCDVAELLAHLQAGRLDEALTLYRGDFLEGIDFELGLELEEWVYGKREWIAKHTCLALIEGAERAASHGNFDKAVLYAERAYRIQAYSAEPEELMRLYAVLLAGNSPYSSALGQELESFGTSPKLIASETRHRLEQQFIGRPQERLRLNQLASGEWLWLKAGAGMGKTTLLKSLHGQRHAQYLPARAGLPYATLEKLLGDKVNQGEALMLGQLLSYRGLWLIDDWENIDPESQKLLRNLRELHPEMSVVISSQHDPAIKVDDLIELGPLSAEELQDYPEAWEKTAGLPYLVAAHLEGKPLDHALELRLSHLSEKATEVYLALALLDDPDLTLVRRALDLDAATMAQVSASLLQAGLIDLGGRPRLKKALEGFLAARSEDANKIALSLARQLQDLVAFSLYERSRLYWTKSDLSAVTKSYLAWGQELLSRGFPQKAYEALRTAPEGKEVTLLRVRTLERSGNYQEALKEIENLSEVAEVLALKGAILWRLGKYSDAEKVSEKALILEKDSAVRAEALNTLGSIKLSQGHYGEAAKLFRRTGALWMALGNQDRYVDSLNNLAVSQSLSGQESYAALQEALEAAASNPRLISRVYLNMGWIEERQGRIAEAITSLEKGIRYAKEGGILATEATIWNNLGVIYHQQQKPKKAQEMYQKTLEISRKIGEKRMVGMALANLAELREDKEAWEEALTLLEISGYALEAEAYRQDLPEHHPFKT